MPSESKDTDADSSDNDDYSEVDFPWEGKSDFTSEMIIEMKDFEARIVDCSTRAPEDIDEHIFVELCELISEFKEDFRETADELEGVVSDFEREYKRIVSGSDLNHSDIMNIDLAFETEAEKTSPSDVFAITEEDESNSDACDNADSTEIDNIDYEENQ